MVFGVIRKARLRAQARLKARDQTVVSGVLVKLPPRIEGRLVYRDALTTILNGTTDSGSIQVARNHPGRQNKKPRIQKSPEFGSGLSISFWGAGADGGKSLDELHALVDTQATFAQGV